MGEGKQKEEIRKKVLSGLFWRFSERMAAQGVQFVVSIVLARILMPEEYGIIALITVFISIASIFVESGMGNALIQKLDADQTDFSTAFYFNIFMGIAMYLILFATAPVIAGFYEEPLLIPVVRVLALSLIVGGINGVQQAYVSRHMQFKRFFFATSIGTLISAVVGIFMAYWGFGVWALVAQNLLNRCIDTTVLWFTVRWRPVRTFSFERMKSLCGFGWKLLVSGLISTLYNNVFSLVIGKAYSAGSLAYYNRGNTIPSMMTSNINSSIQSVLLPALSGEQTNPERLKAMVRRSIMTSAFLMMPAMAGLAAVAKPLVLLLLTEKWLPCVPFMRFSCFIYALWPIHTANLQAVTAVGRSDVFLKLEIEKSILGLAILAITLPRGLMVMMASTCVVSITYAFINAAPNKKILNYGGLEQLKDILPTAALSLIMGILVWLVSILGFCPQVTLFLQIITGVVVYTGGAALLQMESFQYFQRMLLQRRSGRRERKNAQ